MKHNDTVDIETAHKILWFMQGGMQPDTATPRLVIWPEARADEAITGFIDSTLESVPFCTRRLLHLVCFENEIRCLMARPFAINQPTREFNCEFYDIVAPYEIASGETKLRIGAHFVVLDKSGQESLKHPWNQELIKAGEIDVFHVREFLKTPPTAQHAVFYIASILEHFAFSPCATIKQRPRLIKAGALRNPRPEDQLKPREWPAIQIVSLRRPEIARRTPPGESTGRKINVRYDVVEHWRRQPTRAGVKLIKIPAHWRGPKDAPVKPKIEKVYKVTR